MDSPLRWSRIRFPGDRVHGHHEGRVPVSGGPVDQVGDLRAVPDQVELEPQLGRPGPTLRRSSSIPVVAMVDSVYGSPCRAAERAAPISPSGCSIRV